MFSRHPAMPIVLFLGCLVGVVAGGASCRAEHKTAPMPFVTARGDQLFEGDRPLRFVSWNVPNLHLAEDAIEFLGTSPWRFPNEFEIRDALETIRQVHGQVVRCYVLSVRRESSDAGECVHVLGPGEFNEQAFVALDRVLQVANEKRIRLILPLVDYWKWWGGYTEYAAFRDKPPEAFWTDAQIIADFKQTIAHVINRRNTLTGVRYRDDPAIFGWETGNEVYPPAEWTRQIAEYIKSLDENHLVIDGKSLDGVPPESLDDPNVDVITTHHYPSRGEDIAAAIREAIRVTAGKKPYFVGEVGFLPTEELSELIDIVDKSHASGLLMWSLRPHRREGGFYWHSEPMAGGRYKAYHWPGFPSGDTYDERQVLQLARRASFRFRGESVQPAPAPSPPVLLPIDSSLAISWRGSTGASGYDVQRAESPEGRWLTIATNVSDAAHPYRALMHDTDAEIGRSYWYRVVALNETGRSTPSNVVGPVTPYANRLIDELANDAQIREQNGAIKFVTDNPRAVREDRDRALIAPGASIAYEAPGPIAKVVVSAFGANDWPPVVEILTGDPEQPIPTELTIRSPEQSSGDYGYRTPLRIEARRDKTQHAPERQPTRLRIAAPAGASAPIEIARVEITYLPPRAASAQRVAP